jgi:hypothetical protein
MPSTDPPQAFIERINYLKMLLSGLPQTLPLERMVSRYRFYLDEGRVAGAGAGLYQRVARKLARNSQHFYAFFESKFHFFIVRCENPSNRQ